MKNYLEDIIIDISDTYQREGKEVEIQIEGDKVSLNVNQAVPFGILANELIVNAYKYAFKNQNKGKITLRLEREKNILKFSVQDNGIGLPSEFDIDKLSSLGMTLVRTLATQLEAKLGWNSSEGKGTKFTITFTPSVIPKSTWVQKKPDKMELTRPRKSN
jgi:two-component sensor histidine kinase